MAKHSRYWVITKISAALIFWGGSLFVLPALGFAEESPPKSIRLGVNPEHYLQHRHKRVDAVRHHANQPRPNTPAKTNSTSNAQLSLHPDLANRPGFNEFSHLDPTEQKTAQEIMQFLKNFQPPATP